MSRWIVGYSVEERGPMLVLYSVFISRSVFVADFLLRRAHWHGLYV